MQHFTGLDKQPQVEAAPLETLSVEDKLKRCIINGEKALGDGAQKQTLEADTGRRAAESIRRWRSSIRFCWTA